MKDNGYAIHRTNGRAALPPRGEPYWRSLGPNKSLGFRVTESGVRSWLAKHDKDGQKNQTALEKDSEKFSYDEAVKAAAKWFEELDQGLTDDPTVKQCCDAYITNQRDKRKKPKSAKDAEVLLKREVYSKPIANIRLSKLRKSHFQAWIDSQDTSPANLKRRCTVFRASLNLAVKQGKVATSARQAWTAVELPDVPDNRRDLYLDLEQRRALLTACVDPNLRDLVEGVMCTGARASELTEATVSQFDARTGIFKIRDDTKTGARPVPLSNSGLALFIRVSRNKTPLALLFPRTAKGLKWTHSSWDHLLRAAAAAAGLPAKPRTGVCLYTLRHSFVTEALSGGLSTLHVCRMVGTSLQMVEKNYGHLVASVAREQLNRVQLV